MKNKIILQCLTFVASIFVGAFTMNAAEIGQPAPDFTLMDTSGQTRRLSDFLGKTVVLEWINQGCPFVKKHYNSGNMQGLQKEAMADGVVWLVINSGRPGAQGDLNPEEVRQWQKEKGAQFTAYFRDSNGKVGEQYGAKTTPQMYVITAEGTLVYNGAIDSIRSTDIDDIAKAENYVRSALSDLAEGNPVRTSISRPYGCAVKY